MNPSSREIINLQKRFFPPRKAFEPLLTLSIMHIARYTILSQAQLTQRLRLSWAAVVDQLGERPLLKPEVCGSNPIH